MLRPSIGIDWDDVTAPFNSIAIQMANEKYHPEEPYRLDIGERRSNRSKSSFLWLDKTNFPEEKIKLEIGSMVRPDPVTVRSFMSYIQQYLEKSGHQDIAREYELNTVSLNTLCIERTFIDKVFSVRRHAICGSLNQKVRHIYDVVQLMKMNEIKSLLNSPDELGDLIQKCWSIDKFHDEILRPRDFVLSSIVDFDDVRMVEFSDGFRFAVEACGAFGLVSKIGVKELNGDVAVES